MTRVSIEEPMPIESEYRKLLKVAVAGVGGQQRVATLTGVTQSTISRALAEGGRATYQTLVKLKRVLPGIPEPVVAVRDAQHEEWCRLGAVLAGRDPVQFAKLLDDARRALELAEHRARKPSDESISALKSVIAHPLPNRRRNRDRGA